MNDDHADAVVAYARVFGSVIDATSAEMLAIDSDAMELGVETSRGRIVTRIAFDHELTGAGDARDTLIAMARSAMPGFELHG
jgi:putative heme iron utilization protein